MANDGFSGAVDALLKVPTLLATLQAEVQALRSEVGALKRALPPPLVGVEEAARLLGLSVSTIRRRIRDGQLPVVRLGRALRVDLSAVHGVDDEEIAALAELARSGKPRAIAKRAQGG